MYDNHDIKRAALLRVARELDVEDETEQALNQVRPYTPPKPKRMTDEEFAPLLHRFMLAWIEYEDAFLAMFCETFNRGDDL